MSQQCRRVGSNVSCDSFSGEHQFVFRICSVVQTCGPVFFQSVFVHLAFLLVCMAVGLSRICIHCCLTTSMNMLNMHLVHIFWYHIFSLQHSSDSNADINPHGQHQHHHSDYLFLVQDSALGLKNEYASHAWLMHAIGLLSKIQACCSRLLS